MQNEDCGATEYVIIQRMKKISKYVEFFLKNEECQNRL